MNDKELDLLIEMYAKATLASNGEGEYTDPKAKMKADLLKKLIDMFQDSDEDYISTSYFTYKTTDKRDFLLALEAPRLLVSLYEILNWERALYNGKDYGGSVVYRNKLIDVDVWNKRRFDGTDVSFDYEKQVYVDSEGEVPSDEVHTVYTLDQIIDKLDELTADVRDTVYRFME